MEHAPDNLVGEPVDDVPEREPDEYCNARRTDGGTFVGYCQRTSGWGTDRDSGRCSSHGGASPGAEKGNDWAATHGAYSESFVEDFLTEEEIERVRQAEDLLGEAESAQALARTVAGITLEQFRRTGDQRFLQRYESICDTFGIAPADELEINADVDQTTTHELGDDERDLAVETLRELQEAESE
ncbi:MULTISPECIES: hypothetical protein [Halobacterium]|uniref:hypothetical protein n=1 Tax=Halobacterium TaxID=2239 RepID=UPI001964FB90|nr:hypothetical protein [Halobacterium sp. BOL4-2]QRY26371.1 hypothetical protein JRZ79_13050 [Halobacterium sp. BOL4-2]